MDNTNTNNAAALMAPPQKRPNKKRKVLDEDTYLACLEQIIKRDFFPGAAGPGTPTNSLPSTPMSMGDAPPSPALSAVSSSFSTRTQTVPSLDMSLDEFVARYTSEDNASFEKLLEKSNEQKRRKYAWLFQAQEKYNNTLLLTLPPKAAQQPGATTQPQLMLTQGGEPAPPPAQPQGWLYKAENDLIFGPQDHIPFQPDEVTGGPPREINHSNTRIAKQAPRHQPLPAGNLTPLPPPPQQQPPGTGLRSNNLDRYRMLMTPSPVPSRTGGQSPMMTWGDIGTPLRLDEDDGAVRGPSFQIADLSDREKHAIRLSSAAQAKRRKRESSTNEEPPKFSGVLSPAGRRLLAKNMHSPRAKLSAQHSQSHADHQLRQSYSRSTPSAPSRPHTPAVSPLVSSSKPKHVP